MIFHEFQLYEGKVPVRQGAGGRGYIYIRSSMEEEEEEEEEDEDLCRSRLLFG